MNSQAQVLATTTPEIDPTAEPEVPEGAAMAPGEQPATSGMAPLFRRRKFPWSPEDLTLAVESIDVRVEVVENAVAAINEARLHASRQSAAPRALIEFNVGPFRFSFGRTKRAGVNDGREPDAGARAEEHSK